MAKNFDTLWLKMSPERRRRIDDRVEIELLLIALQDLRKARNLTQQEVAGELGLSQSALSKMEHQQDMNVSTLMRIVRALGGELKLVAQFPDTEVVINQFK